MMQGEDLNPRLDPRDQSPAIFLERASRHSLSPRNARRWLALVIGRGECSLAECSRRGLAVRTLGRDRTHRLTWLEITRQRPGRG